MNLSEKSESYVCGIQVIILRSYISLIICHPSNIQSSFGCGLHQHTCPVSTMAILILNRIEGLGKSFKFGDLFGFQCLRNIWMVAVHSGVENGDSNWFL